MKLSAKHLFLLTAVVGLDACGPSATAPQAPIVAEIPAGPPPVAGVIAGSLGSALNEADRRIAADAQYEALQKGQRRSWKSKTGTAFGYVEPAAESGLCRDYTHTVYIDGRSQDGKGQGCRQADGSWKL